jgi:hypothetical protein
VVDRTFSAKRRQPQQQRAENARLTRIERRLRTVHRIGERISVELTLELARRLDAFDLLDQLAERFSTANPETIAALGGDRFPPPPIHLVGGR